jgi:hypothetical protein
METKIKDKKERKKKIFNNQNKLRLLNTMKIKAKRNPFNDFIC